MKVAYLRVSSTSQSLDVQRDAVRKVGVEKIFEFFGDNFPIVVSSFYYDIRNINIIFCNVTVEETKELSD